MGTNYYITANEKLCPTCGKGEPQELHMGKVSAGNRFMLHREPKHWQNSYQLMMFLLMYEEDGDYCIHNDNSASNDVRHIINRILEKRAGRSDMEFRIGYDDLSDHYDSEFS